ncbi:MULTISPECIES: transporter substrate-binding domain-containing protein [Vibrio]|uniref:ABC transporter substrate-binding protein n=5 Tax=Vibrio TaxID=662 RepID=A0A1Q1L2H6_VIBAN|nr:MULTISPECIES: transporter substrate-binding domain-containing protein [Vibrio]NAW97118.1 ABC transporter substrate-binding protein [Vibrio sp. V23_P3S9T160]NAX16498.1 ABC transporter substrate-binding protein [Vibrio sp. V22_P2S10T140]NNN68298.1 ABC transporter substrate-binding protein [Vibrio sp. 3-2(1)]NNN75253.1 ABC transporter substrate-binding protein [Vibrio sp. B7]NNN92172.1 ABC transporter substrate-binding protein [Vibrio sp. B8-1]NNN99607.1 ABC transporter substrate-binding prot
MKSNQLKTIVGLCTSSLAIVQIPFVQAQIDPSNPKLNEPKQMVAHLGELPGLINADGSGPFVELVRYMDKVDPDTEIHIEVFPLHRAVHGVVNKQADFALPAIYVDDPEGKLPFRFSTKSFGLVAHVLYTNKANRITSEQLWSQPDKYYVEAVPSYIPFEVARSNSINASLLKVAAGRIDGFVWAQEEADIALKSLGLENVSRQHFADFKDVFVIAHGSKGDEVDQYLTRILSQLEESGELKILYDAIHRPYDDWQP